MEWRLRSYTFKAKALSVALDQSRAKIKRARLVKYICNSICFVQKCDMATLDDSDLKAIKDLMKVTIDEAIEEKGLVTKEDISHLPNKDEFYGTMDKVMGELRVVRDEQTTQSHMLSEHVDRIEKLESEQNTSN